MGETLLLEPFYIMFLAVLYVIMLDDLSDVQLVHLSVGQLVNNEFQYVQILSFGVSILNVWSVTNSVCV